MRQLQPWWQILLIREISNPGQAASRIRWQHHLSGYTARRLFPQEGVVPVTGPKSRERRQRVEPARIPRHHLRQGELLADIVEDRRGRPNAIVHCVVQRSGAAEVLFLGQFHSRAAAQDAAEQFIAEYFRHHERNSAA